jgi:hypothetical protein
MQFFGDYASDRSAVITTQARAFYPDYLEEALALYGAVFVKFRELLARAGNSADLLRLIVATGDPPRTQLFRVFRKYVSPTTSVEMLKRTSRTEQTIRDFGSNFRPISMVRTQFEQRPDADEALAAIFWEHHDRGTPGYAVSQAFFTWFEAKFGNEYEIVGPRRAGTDVQLARELPKFRDVVPADFVIFRKSDKEPRVVGFARYDSDRGGSQEDDRPGQNQDKARKILDYAARRRIPLKVLFVNDGPGLLLGTMWRDYAALEKSNIVDGELRVVVVTLKMLDDRVTKEWIES